MLSICGSVIECCYGYIRIVFVTILLRNKSSVEPWHRSQQFEVLTVSHYVDSGKEVQKSCDVSRNLLLVVCIALARDMDQLNQSV
jgi:hypothetical protein